MQIRSANMFPSMLSWPCFLANVRKNAGQLKVFDYQMININDCTREPAECRARTRDMISVQTIHENATSLMRSTEGSFESFNAFQDTMKKTFGFNFKIKINENHALHGGIPVAVEFSTTWLNSRFLTLQFSLSALMFEHLFSYYLSDLSIL